MVGSTLTSLRHCPLPLSAMKTRPSGCPWIWRGPLSCEGPQPASSPPTIVYGKQLSGAMRRMRLPLAKYMLLLESPHRLTDPRMEAAAHGPPSPPFRGTPVPISVLTTSVVTATRRMRYPLVSDRYRLPSVSSHSPNTPLNAAAVALPPSPPVEAAPDPAYVTITLLLMQRTRLLPLSAMNSTPPASTKMLAGLFSVLAVGGPASPRGPEGLPLSAPLPTTVEMMPAGEMARTLAFSHRYTTPKESPHRPARFCSPAEVAGSPSPADTAEPMPPYVMMMPSAPPTRLTRPLPLSATNRSPAGLAQLPVGWYSAALIASPPSPLKLEGAPHMPQWVTISNPEVGAGVGTSEGFTDGVTVGTAEGATEGVVDGVAVGTTDGVAVGTTEGTTDGVTDGTTEGVKDGVADGTTEGIIDGTAEGVNDGVADGTTEGVTDGVADGTTEGVTDGDHDGATDGP